MPVHASALFGSSYRRKPYYYDATQSSAVALATILSAFSSASSIFSATKAFRTFALILISSNLAGERPRLLRIDASLDRHED
jgi:hypothetical protein